MTAPSPPAPPAPRSSRPPPLPPRTPEDDVEVISFSSIIAAPDIAAPDRTTAPSTALGASVVFPEQPLPPVTPKPVATAVPPAPITRPLIEGANRPALDVPQTPNPPNAPAFAPAIGGSARRATLETTPSLAPVAMATSLALGSRGDPTMQLRPQPRRSAGVVAALSLVVAAALAGSVVALVAVFQGTGVEGHSTALVDRLRGRTHDEPRVPAAAVAPGVRSTTSPGIVPAPSPSGVATSGVSSAKPVTPPAVVEAAPAPVASAPASAAVVPPSVPVEVLPKSDVEPGMTRVTLPRSSKGHRIFVDGRVVGSGPRPLKIECGTHKVKIGSAGKARVVDLPCGGEVTLD